MSEPPALLPSIALASTYPDDYTLRLAAWRIAEAWDLWSERVEPDRAGDSDDFEELEQAVRILPPAAALCIGMDVYKQFHQDGEPGEFRCLHLRSAFLARLRFLRLPEWAKRG